MDENICVFETSVGELLTGETKPYKKTFPLKIEDDYNIQIKSEPTIDLMIFPPAE